MTPLFSELRRIARRPAPFSVYTARELWTDAHISERMLAFHLNGDIDVSSRRTAFIETSVSWMADRFDLRAGKRVIDFGCGPGLYASRLAALGAAVTGLDFSPRSIAYARAQATRARLSIEYHEVDYLLYEPVRTFDVATMIMYDYCALSPTQRATLLKKFSTVLSGGGRLVFDVVSAAAFEKKREGVTFEENLMDGFWSARPYFGFHLRYTYEKELIGLDKYVIVESDRVRTIYNWLQHFTVDRLERELRAAGLEIDSLLGDVAGQAYDPDGPEFAVVAKRG